MKKITHYLVSMLCYTILLLTGCTSKQQPYCIGADISFVPQSEKGGVVYKNVDGKETDICQIMAAHHFSTPFVCASLSIRRPKKDTLPKKDIVI